MKKQKQEDLVDSEDLQALFDSIASGDQRPGLEMVISPVTDDDDDALQALFDQVAAGFDADVAAGDRAGSNAAARAVSTPGSASFDVVRAASAEQSVFNRIGVMTRQVHDTLRALGDDDALKVAVDAIPDVRQRLTQIAQMTEQAASRVLNATDIARPLQDRMLVGAEDLQARWDRLFSNQMSVEDFKTLAAETRSFLGDVKSGSHATNAQLIEIVMAQDFQDVTGQVMKTVLDLAQRLETDLLQLLIEVTPPERRSARAEGFINGPAIHAGDRDGVVRSQEQVDDLLDSLGF
ncbi:protein phosphatase CheZ [Rhodocyclaceae bacterium SMB388]